MRIACPSCNATYQVPDEQLVVGRVVRCVRCGTDWTPSVAIPPDEPAPEPAPTVEEARPPKPVVPQRQMVLDDEEELPPPSPPAPLPAPPPTRRGVPLLPIAWVLSVAAVVAACAYLAVARETVMAKWPPSVRAYAAVGLARK